MSGGRKKSDPVSRPGGKLTEKQRGFVEAFMGEAKGNATEAAKRAGYSPKTAQEQASRLLSNVMVQQAIAERIAADPAVLTREQLQQFWSTTVRDEGEKMTDRLQASKLLGKSRGEFRDRHELTGADGGPIEVDDNRVLPLDEQRKLEREILESMGLERVRKFVESKGLEQSGKKESPGEQSKALPAGG